MSTLEEQLEEALKKSKTGEVLDKALDIVGQILRMKPGEVALALHTYDTLKIADENIRQKYRWCGLQLFGGLESHSKEDLPALIHQRVKTHVLRAVLAQAINAGEVLHVSIKLFLKKEEQGRICNGCPEAMQCVAQKLSTPEVCYDQKNPTWSGEAYVGRRHYVEFHPKQLSAARVTGEAPQPGGAYTLTLWQLTQPGALEDVW